MPEDYGKTPTPAKVKKAGRLTAHFPRLTSCEVFFFFKSPPPHTHTHTPLLYPAQQTPSQPDLPSGMAKCEFCTILGEKETFLAPSRRFCSLTCCKRYSAEKRYYPYGRDEQGIAQSVREGLLNSNRSTRVLRAGARQVWFEGSSYCYHFHFEGGAWSLPLSLSF